MKKRKRSIWSNEEIDKLVKLYPDNFTEDLCNIFNRSKNSIYGKANLLGLNKSPEHIKKALEIEGEKLKVLGKNTRFVKGQEAHNKGAKMPQSFHEKARHTFFKKGHLPFNTKYDGYIRINVDGYKEIRVRQGKFVLLHRKIWEETHGKIPDGHIIVFKDGNRKNCDISNLKMITFAENGRINSGHYLPEEIRQIIRLKNQLIKKINEK